MDQTRAGPTWYSNRMGGGMVGLIPVGAQNVTLELQTTQLS